MALIVTFLGKGGQGRTTAAIAAAKRYARDGRRVLLISQDPGPALGIRLGQPIGTTPQPIEPNFAAVRLQSTTAIADLWEQLKPLEAQYLRSPILANVYGEELGILPGMDSALAMNALRGYWTSYDIILLDGGSSLETLRQLGTLETASWYARRFRQVLGESEGIRNVAPFLPPIAAALFNVSLPIGFPFDLGNGGQDNLPQIAQATEILDQWRQAIGDPKQCVAYLVSDDSPEAIATAKYLWGSAQQIGLTVAGLLLRSDGATPNPGADFAAIPVQDWPQGSDWNAMIAAVPDVGQAVHAPRPIVIDAAQRQVKLFLPGFDKSQVKLTQTGPELTIEVGDQRRNIALPDGLKGQSVSGAKFQDQYLIISFGS
jgi:anion-transporting  ArsA/GET3 family ATPase/HSP20 family molecular chaperone IbpA